MSSNQNPRQLERARRRVIDAKAAMTRAAEAIHRREPGAEQQADAAIAELTAARRKLNQLTELEGKPEPVGEWAIAAQARDELLGETE